MTRKCFLFRLSHFPESQVRADTGALGHVVIVDLDAKLVHQIGKAGAILGWHELPQFKQVHFLVDFLDEQLELVLVAFLALVELDEALLEGNYEGLEKGVVLVLLVPGREATVDAHRKDEGQ